MAEFEAWAQAILALAPDLPNNPSMRFVLSAMIQKLDSTRDRVPKRHFVKALYRAAAGEIAYNVMYDLKEKQKAEAEAAKAANVVQDGTIPKA
jgi:hypothetical protein